MSTVKGFSPSYGGPFLYREGLFSPFGVSLFDCHCLHAGSLFSPCVEKFLGLFPLTKIFPVAHALAARVVANVSH